MTKYDWLELATRVLGVWFVASGVIGVLGLIDARIAASSYGVETGFVAFTAIGTSFLGTCMVLLAPGFVGWLREKDARAHPRHGEEAGSKA